MVMAVSEGRNLAQAGPGLNECIWRHSVNGQGTCGVNGKLEVQLGAFEALGALEESFFGCFSAENPSVDCARSDLAHASAALRTLAQIDANHDYTTPGPCPYDGHSNPVTSGVLPTEFVHPEDESFVPFKPRTAVLADNSLCTDDGLHAATEQALGQILVKNADGTCQACPEAVCTVWQPDPAGYYTEPCTGVLKLSEVGEFLMKFPMPGDERAIGWGPDPFPHIHMSCEGCGANIYNKWFPKQMPKDYCGTAPELSMQMSQPDISNFIPTAPVGGAAQPDKFWVIMEKGWKMPAAKSPQSYCFVPEKANPCPGYDFIDPTCKPLEPPGDPAVMQVSAAAKDGVPLKATGTPFCAFANLDIGGPAYKLNAPNDGIPAASQQACADACATDAQCTAATYLARPTTGADGSLQATCFVKSGTAGVMPEPVYGQPITLLAKGGCDGLAYRDAYSTVGAGRRLAQAGRTGQAACAARALGASGGAACVPETALLPSVTADKFSEVLHSVLVNPAAFKARCPLEDAASGTRGACTQQWLDYFAVVGCQQCIDNLQYLSTVANDMCGAAATQAACDTAAAAMPAGAARGGATRAVAAVGRKDASLSGFASRVARCLLSARC